MVARSGPPRSMLDGVAVNRWGYVGPCEAVDDHRRAPRCCCGARGLCQWAQRSNECIASLDDGGFEAANDIVDLARLDPSEPDRPRALPHVGAGGDRRRWPRRRRYLFRQDRVPEHLAADLPPRRVPGPPPTRRRRPAASDHSDEARERWAGQPCSPRLCLIRLLNIEYAQWRCCDMSRARSHGGHSPGCAGQHSRDRTDARLQPRRAGECRSPRQDQQLRRCSPVESPRSRIDGQHLRRGTGDGSGALTR